LRHCPTSWKVMGSIPDGVIGTFYLHNLSGRTMAQTSKRNEYKDYFLRGNAAGAYG